VTRKLESPLDATASPSGGDAGFSLIEIIIVISLMAFVYTIAIPQFNLRTGTEIASKLSQIAGDFRNAYDQAVLSGKVYRMVFVFASGDYWLEEADQPAVFLGDDRLDRDLTETEEKDEEIAFDARFQEYVDLAGSAVTDPDTDREISPVSPVVTAKDRLRKPRWSRVDTLEWGPRTLGPYLMIQDMQAEHHGNKQDFSVMGVESRAMIYFFPSGYVERAVIHIAFKKDEMVVDDSQEPYTLTTNPYEGTAEVEPGYKDVDVLRDTES
jgi:prepilin-type N-terminal cleavage/methylation domain-containing protein